jgi:CMP/dCMP kinase
MQKAPKTIAIDGPAASGKSTLAEKLAKHLGYLYFDTGVMYRAVTWAALQSGVEMADELMVTELAEKIQIDVRKPTQEDGRKYDVLLDGKDVTWQIRHAEVDLNVSQVAAYAGVRKAMTNQQRRIGKLGAVVMVGRDIGTVVMPDAELKIYLDASLEERARRRFEEVQTRGDRQEYQKILASMQRRDQIDSTRKVAPLKPAKDAIIIQSDGMSIDLVFEKVKNLIEF